MLTLGRDIVYGVYVNVYPSCVTFFLCQSVFICHMGDIFLL